MYFINFYDSFRSFIFFTAFATFVIAFITLVVHLIKMSNKK
ncbi:putative holin-like toxin [Anaerocolumna jejuensis]